VAEHLLEDNFSHKLQGSAKTEYRWGVP